MGVNPKIVTRITAREYAWFTIEDFNDLVFAERALRMLCDAMIDGCYFFYNVPVRGGILGIEKEIREYHAWLDIPG